MKSFDKLTKDIERLEKQLDLLREAQDKILALCQVLYNEVKELKKKSLTVDDFKWG